MAKTQRDKKKEKKSETIEVRVSHSEKEAFMEACKNEGTTASQTIRDFISQSITPENRLKTYGLLGAIFFFIIALASYTSYTLKPTNAVSENSERIITYFDQNKDGVVSKADLDDLAKIDQQTAKILISQSDTNKDGIMTKQEFDSFSKILIELNSLSQSNSHAQNSSGHKPIQKVIIVPPTLNEEERKAFIAKVTEKANMSKEDLKRLTLLLEAIAASQN